MNVTIDTRLLVVVSLSLKTKLPIYKKIIFGSCKEMISYITRADFAWLEACQYQLVLKGGFN